MGAPVEPPTLSHRPSVRLPCAVCAPSSPAAAMEQEDRLQEEQGERGRAVLCGPRIWREGYHEASGLGAYLYLWHGSPVVSLLNAIHPISHPGGLMRHR